MKQAYFIIHLFSTVLLAACGAETSLKVVDSDTGSTVPISNSGDTQANTATEKSFTVYDDRVLADTVARTNTNTVFLRANNNALPQGISFNLNNNGTFTYQNKNKANSVVTIAVNAVENNETEPTIINLNFHNKTDALFFEQWHLNSTGQKAFSRNAASIGHDINIGTLHYQGVTGKGIKVAVADTGLEINHADLRDNVLANRSWNYTRSNNNPTPTSTEGDHGTAVAGLIAAKAFNGVGGRGVAPDASLLGFNILENWTDSAWLETHGGSRTTDVLIVNQSYGMDSVAPMNFDSLENKAHEQHLAEITTELNNKRGVLMLKAAGNSFEYIETEGYNYNSKRYTAFKTAYAHNPATAPKLSASITGIEDEASSFYHTVVSALNADASSPHASYSTVGASVWVAALGGEFGVNQPAMITTDLMGCNRGYSLDSLMSFNSNQYGNNPNCNYISNFNGTSSAAPIASGVAALIFAANDKLSWRDVRHIMASTAKKIDTDFSPVKIFNNGIEFIAEPGWLTNAAGYNFHNWYGFGMLDASAAVAMATDDNYQPLPALQVTDFIQPSTLSTTIPENDNNGASNSIIISADLSIEAIQVKLSASHERDADLAIEVTSPNGTKSMLLQPQSLLIEDQMDGRQDANFENTVLLSNVFYGESSQGEWTIKVIDINSGDFIVYATDDVLSKNWDELRLPNNSTLGTLTALSLRIYGH